MMKDQNILIQNGVDIKQGLALFGDIEMYNESLGDFMGEINGKLTNLAKYKEMSDMTNYAIIVHSLKSDAKYFGFNTLADMAYHHELESKSNNVIYVNENYETLITEANRIISVVTKYMGGDSTTSNVVSTPVNNPAPQKVPEAAPEVKSENISILIVDDSDIIQNFIKKTFAENFNVITASDGAEAIRVIETNSDIAAMLLDLNMPNVDGFKVLEYMKEKDLFKNLPVSIITGNDSKDTDLRAFDYPIVDILKKPFNDISIKNILERTLGHR